MQEARKCHRRSSVDVTSYAPNGRTYHTTAARIVPPPCVNANKGSGWDQLPFTNEFSSMLLLVSIRTDCVNGTGGDFIWRQWQT